MKSLLRSPVAYLEEINKPSVKTCMARKERISKMLVAAYASEATNSSSINSKYSGHADLCRGQPCEKSWNVKLSEFLLTLKSASRYIWPSQKFYHLWPFI